MKPLVRSAVLAIRGYQWFSRFLPPRCRFYPSCSEYMCQALEHFGMVRGLALGMMRLLHCHPWHPGGYEPVPELANRGRRTADGIHTPPLRRTPHTARRFLLGGNHP